MPTTDTPPVRSFWDKMASLPPIACRILARTKKATGGMRLMTDREIARNAGMDVSQVKSLSWKTSWADVSIAQARAFSEACGIQFDNRRNWQKQMAQLKNTRNAHYLRKSPAWHEMKERIKLWAASRSRIECDAWFSVRIERKQDQ